MSLKNPRKLKRAPEYPWLIYTEYNSMFRLSTHTARSVTLNEIGDKGMRNSYVKNVEKMEKFTRCERKSAPGVSERMRQTKEH